MNFKHAPHSRYSVVLSCKCRAIHPSSTPLRMTRVKTMHPDEHTHGQVTILNVQHNWECFLCLAGWTVPALRVHVWGHVGASARLHPTAGEMLCVSPFHAYILRVSKFFYFENKLGTSLARKVKVKTCKIVYFQNEIMIYSGLKKLYVSLSYN